VLVGAPFGHGAPNRAFVLGATATVEGGALRFAPR
jgi:muramoyltetrapeptide carboxypeptidase LdcA involved in peptidoglycan recycling